MQQLNHPTDVPCPFCGAAAGAVCTIRGIRRQQGPHKTRLNEYTRVRRIAQAESSDPQRP